MALCDAKVPVADAIRRCGLHEPPARLLTLKALNLLAARHDFETSAVLVDAHPIGLTVDPSNGCNLGCPACVHSSSVKESGVFDWRGGVMPPARMDGFLSSYAPFAAQIYFYNFGEPLLNPRTPDFVSRAKRMMTSTVISSSLSLSKLNAEALVSSGLDLLTVSIDGVSQETYERFRRGGELARVFENIENIVKAKRNLGRDTPILNWQFLQFEHNRHERNSVLTRARELGMNKVTFGVPYDVDWDDPSIQIAQDARFAVEKIDTPHHYLRENTRAVLPPGMAPEEAWDIEATNNAFDRAFLPRDVDPDVIDQRPPERQPCSWLHKNMVVDANGRVLTCCAPPGRDYDITAGTEAPGSPLFNSSRYQAARMSFSNPKAFVKKVGDENWDRAPHCADCSWGQGPDSVNADRSAVMDFLIDYAGETMSHEIMRDLCWW